MNPDQQLRLNVATTLGMEVLARLEAEAREAAALQKIRELEQKAGAKEDV